MTEREKWIDGLLRKHCGCGLGDDLWAKVDGLCLGIRCWRTSLDGYRVVVGSGSCENEPLKVAIALAWLRHLGVNTEFVPQLQPGDIRKIDGDWHLWSGVGWIWCDDVETASYGLEEVFYAWEVDGDFIVSNTKPVFTGTYAECKAESDRLRAEHGLKPLVHGFSWVGAEFFTADGERVGLVSEILDDAWFWSASGRKGLCDTKEEAVATVERVVRGEI